MAAKGLNVFVNIGATVLGSVNSSASKVESRLMAMSRKFKAASIESSLAIAKFQNAAGGLMGLAAAGGIGYGLTKAIGAGAELDHEIQALRNAGRTSQQVAQAIAAANKTILDLPTSTLAGNLAMINETTSAFGDYGHAIANVGRNQKLAFLLSNSSGEGGRGDQTRQIGDLIRMLEMRGAANDEGRYTKESEMAYKAMMFTRGRVGGSEFRAFGATGNPLLKSLSDDYLYKIAPALMQEYGADQAGTMHQALANTILGKVGMGGKNYADEWAKLGLLDPSLAKRAQNGSMTGWKAGAIAGTDTFLRNPLQWAEQTLLPALQKNGVDVDDPIAVQKQLGRLIGKNTAARLLGSLINTNDRKRLHKDAAFTDQVQGVDRTYMNTLLNDPKAGLAALKASGTNLMAVLSGPVLIPIARALVSVADGINMIAAAAEAHPNLTHGLVGLGVALTGLKVASLGLGAGHAYVVKFFADTAAWVTGGLASGVARLRLAFIGLRSAMIGAYALAAVGGWRAMAGALLGVVTPTNLLKFAMSGLKLTLAGLGIGVLVMACMWLVNNARNIGVFFKAMGDGVAQAAPFMKPFVEMIGNAFRWIEGVIGPGNPERWAAWGHAVGGAIGGVLQGLRNLVDWLGKAIQHMREFFSVRGNVTANFDETGASLAGQSVGNAVSGKRARGGGVRGGHLYAINENGQELFAPGRNGQVVTARATAALLAAASLAQAAPAAAGSVGDVTIIVQGAHDPGATAREVRRVFKEIARENRGGLHD